MWKYVGLSHARPTLDFAGALEYRDQALTKSRGFRRCRCIVFAAIKPNVEESKITIIGLKLFKRVLGGFCMCFLFPIFGHEREEGVGSQGGKNKETREAMKNSSTLLKQIRKY